MAKLKAKLNPEEYDALPEVLREFYVAQGDGFALEAEGVEDVTGLKSALDKEKEERRKAKALLDNYKDLDPEAARDALSKVKDLEEKKLRSAGEFDKLKEQMIEHHNQEIKKLAEREQFLKQNIEGLLVDAKATEAIAKNSGSVKLLMPIFKAHSRVVEQDGKFTVEILDDKGMPRVSDANGTPFTYDNLAEELKASDDFAGGFKSSGASGSGSPNFTNGGTGGKRTIRSNDQEAINSNLNAIAKGEITVVD